MREINGHATRTKAVQIRNACVVGIVAMAAGCTNLQAVSDISRSLSTASASWKQVAMEVNNSCEREREFNTRLLDCDQEKLASEGLVAANALLADYFGALGAAANESNFTIQPGLDAASGSVAKIPGISSEQASAASGLFSSLAKLVTGRLREKTLRDLIENGAPPASRIVGAMDELLVARLKRRLDLEKQALNSTFAIWLQAEGMLNAGTLIGSCGKPNATLFQNPTDGPKFLLAQQYCDRFEKLSAREKALAGYEKSLKNADLALAELQSSKTDLKAKELAAKLYEIGSDLKDHIAAVETAFD